ncbi:MAG: PAS domain-containing sensor histidine kinase, partial [Halanaeroarchaeum sp.]
EDTHDALMLFDRDGYFDCNGTALGLFGVDSVEEFVEYAPWEFAPPEQPDGTDSKEAALARIDEALEEGNAFFEFTHQRVDGTEFPAEVKLSRFEHEGEPALHSLVRDITERKEYERRLEAQRDNLDILNQMVRPDIRNELQVVLAYAESLGGHVDDAAEEYVEQVLNSARYAADITETARDVAEVMVQADAELAPVNVRHVVGSEIDDVGSSHEMAVVETEGTIPDVEVLADDLFESVVRNLLKNAIDHNDEEVARVAVSATETESDVRLRVADNGPGISDDRKETIFEEGEQGLDSDGTGLGLYLVQTLVDRYGGEVWVEDNDPNGAVFFVELPIHS